MSLLPYPFLEQPLSSTLLSFSSSLTSCSILFSCFLPLVSQYPTQFQSPASKYPRAPVPELSFNAPPPSRECVSPCASLSLSLPKSVFHLFFSMYLCSSCLSTYLPLPLSTPPTVLPTPSINQSSPFAPPNPRNVHFSLSSILTLPLCTLFLIDSCLIVECVHCALVPPERQDGLSGDSLPRDQNVLLGDCNFP